MITAILTQFLLPVIVMVIVLTIGSKIADSL